MKPLLTTGVIAMLVCPTAPADAATPTPGAPANLRCEYRVDPLGIDAANPRLSWEMTDPRIGAVQTAYQIIVADDPAALAADRGNLWDTGKVASDRSVQIEYAGRSLRARLPVWWKVRVWDAADQPSPWSAPATWSMGLLTPDDWHARWIGDPTPPPPVRPPNNGYHSELANDANAQKWVAIDLGTPTAVDAVTLYPARPYNWREDTPGFLFPVRFKIEVASQPDFSDAQTVVDRTAADVPNPGVEPLTCAFPATTGRYVRLVVTHLRAREPEHFGFALAELQVLRDGTNLAVNQPVTASDTIERPEWSTRFLVDNDLVSHAATGLDPLAPPLLRKAFELAAATDLKRATVYVTALGFYELRINGQRVGDHQLAPEWTDYHTRVQYQTYDVRNLLHAGENALGVQLADGWYAGRIGLSQIVPDGPARAIYGRQPRLLLQLELEYADGKTERLVSDDSWRVTTAGPVRVADLLDGEVYDAQRELLGWDAPGYDESAWTAAAIVEPAVGRLVAQPNEPIRITREIQPVQITEPTPGVYVFDFGQNFAGWCRLKTAGAPGQTVTLQHAEVLNLDGTIYTENLRSAAATDRCRLRGGGVETYEPRFTYHGFRYVAVTGLAARPTADTLVGCVVRSDVPDAGTFECSEPLLNRLWQNIRWTQWANMPSIPTDCPQRDERLGWMGDILAFAQTACFNADMAAFFTKWVPDVRDAQTADGRYPDFAPHPYDPDARFSGVPAWGDAGVFVPWCQYCNYGDTRLLAQHFDSARRWVDWIHVHNPDLLWQHDRHNDYGDWLNADTLKLAGWPAKGAEMPKEAFATAFFFRSTQIVAQMAAVLGRDDDARRYAALADDIREAFQHAYIDAEGRIAGDTQAGYAIALDFDLVPETLRAAAAQRMVACFARYDGQISTGFHSTICLMKELTRSGYVADAYRLILNRNMPSWGYAIEHGATTIWERWDGYVEGRGFQDPGMNSFAHYALGSVGEWMTRTIVGINPDPNVPAYKHFILRPRPGGGLTWARGTYHAIYGQIQCAWRIADAQLHLDIHVPANTSATLYLPTTDATAVTVGGVQLDAAAGVTAVRSAGGTVACELAAGHYVIELNRTE